MSSVTGWSRLEPRTRRADMQEGLAARVWDPLWLLARQWQVGEFQGQDAGTPVLARLTGNASPLSRLRTARSGPGTLYRPAATALEPFVEGDPAPGASLETRVAAGQAFLRRLAKGRPSGAPDGYRAAFATALSYALGPPTEDERLRLDPAGLALWTLAAGRVPDGAKLYTKFKPLLTGGALPGDAPIAAVDRAVVAAAAGEWATWYQGVFEPAVPASGAWVPERLEYEFAVATHTSDREVVLRATEFTGGRLDWHSFDVGTGSLGAAQDPAPQSSVRTVIPTPLRYNWQLPLRWWQFDDAKMDLGSIEAGPEDIARLLLLEFAVRHGHDWYVIPIQLDVGTCFVTERLEVSDTFGQATLVPPVTHTPGETWRMFQPSVPAGSTAGPPPGFFFLAPALGPVQEGPPVEEVHFIRDDAAEVAWAIERIVEAESGWPLDRYEAFQAAQAAREPAQPPARAGYLAYRLVTPVPDFWYPLLPVKTDTDVLMLRLGEVADGLPANPSLGHILTPFQPTRSTSGATAAGTLLHDAEVPGIGIKVARCYRYGRWSDGSTHLWVARRVRLGRSEGPSGLRFDYVEPV